MKFRNGHDKGRPAKAYTFAGTYASQAAYRLTDGDELQSYLTEATDRLRRLLEERAWSEGKVIDWDTLRMETKVQQNHYVIAAVAMAYSARHVDSLARSQERAAYAETALGIWTAE